MALAPHVPPCGSTAQRPQPPCSRGLERAVTPGDPVSSALPRLSVNELNLPGPLCSDVFQIKKIKILVGS